MRKRILSARQQEQFMVLVTAVFSLLSILGLLFGLYWAVHIFFKTV